jgi:tetratricopeptide (TPR) repeat protein
MNTEAVGQLGRIYAKDGRMNDAASCLLKAAELEPNNTAYQLALGQVYQSFRDSTNAVKIALRILSTQPTNEEALLLLVNTSTPVPELRQEVDGLPRISQNPAYHLAEGLLDLREQKFAEAETQLRQALSENPKSSQAYFALAGLHAVQKNEKEAAAALQNAAAFAPLRSPIRGRYADYLYERGSIDEAWKVLKEMTEKAPDYLPGWVSSMNLALAQKKYDDADKFADTILTRDSKNYDGLMGRGMISLARGDAIRAHGTPLQEEPASQIRACPGLSRDPRQDQMGGEFEPGPGFGPRLFPGGPAPGAIGHPQRRPGRGRDLADPVHQESPKRWASADFAGRRLYGAAEAVECAGRLSQSGRIISEKSANSAADRNGAGRAAQDFGGPRRV